MNCAIIINDNFKIEDKSIYEHDSNLFLQSWLINFTGQPLKLNYPLLARRTFMNQQMNIPINNGTERCQKKLYTQLQKCKYPLLLTETHTKEIEIIFGH